MAKDTVQKATLRVLRRSRLALTKMMQALTKAVIVLLAVADLVVRVDPPHQMEMATEAVAAQAHPIENRVHAQEALKQKHSIIQLG